MYEVIQDRKKKKNRTVNAGQNENETRHDIDVTKLNWKQERHNFINEK